MNMGSYEYIAQEKIIWGQAAAQALDDESKRLGLKKIFIICSKSLNRNSSLVKEIAEQLGDKIVGIFDECKEHTPRSSVIDAVNAVRLAKPDIIVSIGGGTVIDTSKVVLVALSKNVETVSDLDNCHLRINSDGSRFVPDVPEPPIRQIAISTTLSGAEYSCLGGATDEKRKVKDGYYGKYVCPKSVILDPQMTIATPDWLWYSTGIRALDHAIESICSINEVPLVTACAKESIRLLKESLLKTKKNPGSLDARLDCLRGAWLASQGILRVNYGASHGIGHSLGAVTGLSHGYTSCVLLPSVLRWNRKNSDQESKQNEIANLLGRSDGDAALAVEDLRKNWGRPARLRDVEVSRSDFKMIAEGAMGNIWVNTNPRKIEKVDDVIDILEEAY